MRFFSEKVDDLVIDQTTGGLFDGPAIAWLSADTYVVTWEHSPTDSGTHDIYARVFNVDGIPQTDALWSTPRGRTGATPTSLQRPMAAS